MQRVITKLLRLLATDESLTFTRAGSVINVDVSKQHLRTVLSFDERTLECFYDSGGGPLADEITWALHQLRKACYEGRC